MADISKSTSLSREILTLLSNGQSREDIETTLVQKGHDEWFVKEIVQETVKLRNAKNRSQALSLILAGALICFLSFILTITSAFSHNSFPIVLYGLTSIGILVVFAGFVKIF